MPNRGRSLSRTTAHFTPSPASFHRIRVRPLGLLRRLEPVVERHRLHPAEGLAERIAFAKARFGEVEEVNSYLRWTPAPKV